MFGPMGGGFQQYQQSKKDAKGLPRREVTEKQFIKLLISRDGSSKEEAEKIARISKALGSHVQVGSEMLSIKSNNKG